MPEALRPGERWSLDFLSDRFGASRTFRILAVNDDGCRENLCLIADISISSAGTECPYASPWKARQHCQRGANGCATGSSTTGRGAEFTSRAILKWARENDVD